MKFQTAYKRSVFLLVSGLLFLGSIYSCLIRQTSFDIEVKKRLEETIGTISDNKTLLAGHRSLFSTELLVNYYKRYNYSPVWIGNKGLLPVSDTLVAILKKSYSEGLNPPDYHLTDIETLLDSLKHSGKRKSFTVISQWTHIEILLSDAFFTYAIDLYAGRIHSEKENVEWSEHIALISPIDSLQKIAMNGNIKTMLQNFSCTHTQYLQLKSALDKYFHVKQWPLLPVINQQKKGDKSSFVVLLRQRLRASGDLAENGPGNDSVFDAALENAIKKIQRRYGLNDNGLVSPEVIDELNEPAEIRARKIAFNMERWRWLPREIKQPYIMINIADFKLELVNNNEIMMNMKIIVGAAYHQTPLFNANMTYLVLNPYWEIPNSIARNEMLPEIKKNKSYFVKNHIKIYDDWKPDAKELFADSIGWDTITPDKFNYRLRQMPGPWNALGRIKFMFPNQYNVYLHDTPQRELFSKTVRTFSHGCIRIEKPIELATYLLRNDTSLSENKLLAQIDSAKEKTVTLPVPIKVYICYWTAWEDKEGLINFRKDIYQYDKELEKLMRSDYSFVRTKIEGKNIQ
jgi:L,D-transpeptidase YcbB